MKPMMRRTGLPQGLSMSPILATLAIELLYPPKGLVMYADDGLVISEKKQQRGGREMTNQVKSDGDNYRTEEIRMNRKQLHISGRRL